MGQAKDYHHHALEIQSKQLGSNKVDVAKFYNNLGNLYRKKVELAQAKDYYHRAVEIHTKQTGSNHVDLAASYHNLGTLYDAKDEIMQKLQREQHVSLA